MTTKLLPCPKCKEHSDVRISETYPGFYLVYCYACYDGEGLSTHSSVEQAAEEWNVYVEEENWPVTPEPRIDMVKFAEALFMSGAQVKVRK